MQNSNHSKVLRKDIIQKLEELVKDLRQKDEEQNKIEDELKQKREELEIKDKELKLEKENLEKENIEIKKKGEDLDKKTIEQIQNIPNMVNEFLKKGESKNESIIINPNVVKKYRPALIVKVEKIGNGLTKNGLTADMTIEEIKKILPNYFKSFQQMFSVYAMINKFKRDPGSAKHIVANNFDCTYQTIDQALGRRRFKKSQLRAPETTRLMQNTDTFKKVLIEEWPGMEDNFDKIFDFLGEK